MASITSVIVLVAACGHAVARVEGRSTTTSSAVNRPASRPGRGHTPEAHGGGREAIGAAWLAALNAFYEASHEDNARLPALIASLVPGSPSYKQETTFVAALAVSGVAGPPRWRIGEVEVRSVAGATATVSGCSFDEGSHYRASGTPAPPSLGGSPGLTGYFATMKDVGGSWRLYTMRVTFPSSTKEAGPCHDFAYDRSA